MLSREEKIQMLMEKYQYDYVEYGDWHESNIDLFKYDMKEEGIIDADNIYFDLYRNSTAAITGSFDCRAFIKKNAAAMIKLHKLNPFELRKALKSEGVYYYFDCSASLDITNYGNQTINYEYSTEYDEDDGNEPDSNITEFFEKHLEDWIQEHVEEWGSKIHNSLDASYDHYTSEEFVIEELQAREIIDENLNFIDQDDNIYPEEESYWEETTEPEPAPAEYADAA